MFFIKRERARKENEGMLGLMIVMRQGKRKQGEKKERKRKKEREKSIG